MTGVEGAGDPPHGVNGGLLPITALGDAQHCLQQSPNL